MAKISRQPGTRAKKKKKGTSYFKLSCPNCDKGLKISRAKSGQKVRCPYCHEKLTVPSARKEADKTPPPPRTEAAKPRTKARAKPPERQPVSPQGDTIESTDATNVSMLKSAGIGIAIAAAFLLAVALPLKSIYFGQLFLDRGWVPFVLAFLMGWSVAILILKYLKIRSNQDAMLFDVLPDDQPDITPDNLETHVKHVNRLPVNPNQNFLVNRVLRALEHFGARQNNAEVAAMMNSQAEIDANSVDSSYTIIKVFIWAIPILGFIGTVLGISDAVGGFSADLASAEDIDALKDQLGVVTRGLSVAFDTTLLALIMSLLVSFPTSALQKREEDLLNWVDEYCNENLIKRLDDGGGGGEHLGDQASIRRAIDAAMAVHHAEFRNWREQLEGVGTEISDEIAEGWRGMLEEARENDAQRVARLNEAIEALQGKDDLCGLVDHVKESMEKLDDLAAAAGDRAATSMEQTAGAIQHCFTQLESGVAALNATLERMGEKKIVLEERKRSWLPFFGSGKKK